MNSDNVANVFDQNCPSRKALEIVSAKWAVLAVHALGSGAQRYNQLLEKVGGISPKMLTQVLKSLQEKNIITKLPAQSGEHVEYSLTSLGRSLNGPLSELCRWAESHQDEISAVDSSEPNVAIARLKKHKTKGKMKSTFALLCCLAFCGHAIAQKQNLPNCAAISTQHQHLDEDTIRRIEQDWLTAEYRGNPQFLDCLLEPDYRTFGKSGQIRTRREVIDHVPLTTNMSKPVPALQTLVIIHGTSATAHSIMRTTDKDGNPKEVHFIDAYTFHDGRWFAYSGADF